MALNPVKVLKATIRSFKLTVDAEPHQKVNNVSIQLAQHYNSLREKASQEAEIAQHLPPPISTQSTFSDLGFTDATLTDLKVFLNQMLALVEVLEEQ